MIGKYICIGISKNSQSRVLIKANDTSISELDTQRLCPELLRDMRDIELENVCFLGSHFGNFGSPKLRIVGNHTVTIQFTEHENLGE